jgi:3',5'-cyclic-AMP phosphodiesterase
MKQIAFITDLHLGESIPKELGIDTHKNFQRVLDDLQERNIGTIIIGGDIGEANELEWFFNKLSGYKVFIILGNHDRYENVVGHLQNQPNEGLGELYHSFDDRLNRYIFMDSAKETINDVQLSWLEEQLNTVKNILLFIHHPVLAVDTSIDKVYPLQNRAVLLSKLEKLENKVSIFCGHYHMESVEVKNNVSQFITPAVSFQVVKDAKNIETTNRDFGYRVLNIDAGIINTEIVTFS